jgi:hypothetical protein
LEHCQRQRIFVLRDIVFKSVFLVYSSRTPYPLDWKTFDTEVWKGVMTRQGSPIAEMSIHFDSDKKKYQQKVQSEKPKSERKREKQMIEGDFEK